MVAVSVVFATKEAVEEAEPAISPVVERENSGIKAYIEAHMLQLNATSDAIGENDPRYLALQWILHIDKLQLQSLDWSLSQRYILVLIAFSLDSAA